MGKQKTVAVAACLFCFGVPVGVTTWAERWEELGPPGLSPAWPPGGNMPVSALAGAGEARVPCPAVSRGGAHANGLHHVRRLEVRAGKGL